MMMSAEMPLVPVSQNELQTMAYTDPLTGLGNRHRMRDKVMQISAERASDPAPFTIGIANLDSFKPINDLFGSAAGDEILCQVAHRLKACIPDGALVTRHDGDEFAFVLPLVFERASAEKFGQMIREVLSAPYDLGDRNVRLSASFGFAIHPFAGESFEDLVKSAETALYRSKRRGRGQITVSCHPRPSCRSPRNAASSTRCPRRFCARRRKRRSPGRASFSSPSICPP